MSETFCDWVQVTVPEAEWVSLRDEVSAELDAIGMCVDTDQDRQTIWRSRDGFGTVNAKRIGRVLSIGASGHVCAGLRLAGRFGSYLAALGSRPHRVTRLDVSLDIPVDAAPIVASLASAGRRGELSLTRKRIKPSQVETRIGLRADGVETGTVYLGSRAADALMVVYDKQHERMSRRGLSDVGPLTRFEVRLRSGTGVTLRDAYEPEGAFWHYAAPDILPLPEGVLPWAPDGSGFSLPALAPLLPAQRLLRRLDGSADFDSLLKLARACGPHGVEFLCSQIRRRARGGVQGHAPADALSGGVGPPQDGLSGVSALAYAPAASC